MHINKSNRLALVLAIGFSFAGLAQTSHAQAQQRNPVELKSQARVDDTVTQEEKKKTEQAKLRQPQSREPKDNARQPQLKPREQQDRPRMQQDERAKATLEQQAAQRKAMIQRAERDQAARGRDQKPALPAQRENARGNKAPVKFPAQNATQQRRLQPQQQRVLIQQQQQRVTKYRQNVAQRQSGSRQQGLQLQQQKRMSQYRYQQQYYERMRQQQSRYQNERHDYNNDPYFYTASSYRYNRGGRYYETNRYGADILRQALNYGYQEGMRAGRADQQDHWRYSYRDSYIYQDANYGYNGYYVQQDDYNYYFREGFQRGYEDGFYGRHKYGRNTNGTDSLLGTVLLTVLALQAIR